MIEKIKALMQEVERLKADNAEELEALRIRYFDAMTRDMLERVPGR